MSLSVPTQMLISFLGESDFAVGLAAGVGEDRGGLCCRTLKWAEWGLDAGMGSEKQKPLC